MSREIYIFADWEEFDEPTLVGTLRSDVVKTKEHLNINETDNSLNYELALEVIDYFQLTEMDAVQIKNEVLQSVVQWESVATKIGLGRAEQQLMAPAFNV